jgi:hypothetical protein
MIIGIVLWVGGALCGEVAGYWKHCQFMSKQQGKTFLKALTLQSKQLHVLAPWTYSVLNT